MSGVGPGTVLGGRYVITRRLDEHDGAQQWQAEDSTLQRAVTVLVVPESHRHAAALLDAARRSAVVDNINLVRVHDVGQSDGVAFVVEETLAGSHSLAELAVGGGMPSEEVRRMIGLTARGLEAARVRGLHHEALSPRSVLRTPAGEVKLVGLATTAALRGLDSDDADAATRTDTVGAVALLYAGLTGLWPLDDDADGLTAAPWVGRGPARPSEVASGVPGDLDDLCSATLLEDRGPATPGDLARRIAPWSHEPVQGVGGGRVPAERGGGAPTPADHDSADPPEDVASRVGGTAAAVAGSVAAAADTGSSAAGPAPSGGDPMSDSRDRSSAAAGTPGDGGTMPLPVLASDADDPTVGSPDGDSAGAPNGTADTGDTAGLVAALGSATTATKDAVGSVSGKVGHLARTAAQRSAERRVAKAAALEWTEDHRVPLADTLTQPPADQSGMEPPVPLLDPDTVGPLDKDESRLALALVAGLLIVALIVGVWGLTRIGSGVNLGLGSDSAQTTLATKDPDASPTTTPSPSATAATSTAPLQDLGILSARAYDPEGDKKENDGEVGRVYDGNKSTVWTSEGYNTADFGGLKKGVGVILDLGSNAKPKQVEVTQTTASTYTVYLADERSLDGARKVGSSAQADTVTLPVPAGVTGQYLIVWFTQVAKASDGQYRASLAEVSAQG